MITVAWGSKTHAHHKRKQKDLQNPCQQQAIGKVILKITFTVD
jgi:hypothetical protein